MRHDPRYKQLFENNNVIIPSDEDNQGEDNEEWFHVNDLFGHLYCGCVILLCISIMANYVFIFLIL